MSSLKRDIQCSINPHRHANDGGCKSSSPGSACTSGKNDSSSCACGPEHEQHRHSSPIFPPHIHINQKNLFGALSPIGPIPRHLSRFSLFSSQPSPFPLPFHSHWFSLFSQCRSRAVTLIHSPFDNSQNLHWSVFIHDEIRIVSRAASTEHPNPPSIASF